jgi:hypothetical protein
MAELEAFLHRQVAHEPPDWPPYVLPLPPTSKFMPAS